MGSKPIEWGAIRDEHDRAMIKDMYEAAQKGKVLHKLQRVKDLMDPSRVRNRAVRAAQTQRALFFAHVEESAVLGRTRL